MEMDHGTAPFTPIAPLGSVYLRGALGSATDRLEPVELLHSMSLR